MIDVENLHIVVDIVIALATVGALVVTVSLHKVTSFQTLYTAMIDMLRIQITSQSINHTHVRGSIPLLGFEKNSTFDKIDKNSSIYKNFVEYYQANVDGLKVLSLDGMVSAKIWNIFVEQLYNRAEFEQIFKYLYDCIVTIDRSGVSNSVKTHYVRLLSDMLTTDQLFCYMINQAHFCKGDCSEDNTVAMLKKYDFFRDLFSSSLYDALNERFSVEFIKCFRK